MTWACCCFTRLCTAVPSGAFFVEPGGRALLVLRDGVLFNKSCIWGFLMGVAVGNCGLFVPRAVAAAVGRVGIAVFVVDDVVVAVGCDLMTYLDDAVAVGLLAVVVVDC